jgi:hypothetical protein
MKTQGADICTVDNGGRVSLPSLKVLTYEEFSADLLLEVEQLGRIAAYFAVPAADDKLELYAVVARDWQGDLRLLRTRIAGSVSSLTPSCPQVHLFEREIAEQYGVVFEGHPWFKPVRFHSAWRPVSMPGGVIPPATPSPATWSFTGWKARRSTRWRWVRSTPG